MDFFGFGAAADLSTPVGQMIKSGTDSLLLGPDWTKNLEICDVVSSTREGPEHALKALLRRLQDNEQNTVYLALVIFEACFKNCANFVAVIDRPAMGELSSIASGSKGDKNAYEAQRMIQTWGRQYEGKRGNLFFDTYMTLRARGVQFPREESGGTGSGGNSRSNSVDAPRLAVKIKAPASAPAPAPAPAPEPRQPSVDESVRLEGDLGVVMEKVRMCREMMLVSPGIEEDETLADVVGFLEACRDRMAEVIEAGTQGLLGEELFALCLRVNDAVLRTLEAEKTGTRIEVYDEDNSKASGSSQRGGEASLLDLHIDSPAPAASKASMLDAAEAELFGSLDNKAAVKVGGSATKKQPAKSSVITSAPAPAPAAAFDPFGNAPAAAAPPAAASNFDPFGTASPPPAAPAATNFDPFGNAPQPAAPAAAPAYASPTPFDDLLSIPAPAPASGATAATATAAPPKPATAAGMSDVDFDAFFNDLGKPTK